MMAEISFIWRGYGLSLKREEKKYMNNKHWIKNLFGAIAIPLLVAILLQGLCIIKGRTMIANMTSFDNFVVYIAIVMITTIALSINLNSGRFDFSLGSMATLSSVLGAKITYSVLDGGNYSALMMFVLTLLIGMLLGLISGILYVVLHLPPIITSLGVTLIYEGILFTITEGRYVMKEVQNKSMTAFTGNWIYAAIIIVAVLLISIAIFDYTNLDMITTHSKTDRSCSKYRNKGDSKCNRLLCDLWWTYGNCRIFKCCKKYDNKRRPVKFRFDQHYVYCVPAYVHRFLYKPVYK